MGRVAITVDTQHNLLSAIEEPIRELRTNILTGEEKYSSILFTSTHQGEGKSTISLYLALSLSRSGKKTVWMDCSFREKNELISFQNTDTGDTVEKSLGGLAEYLNGTVDWNEIIYPVVNEKLEIIPCGNTENMSCEMLEQSSFLELLEEMKQNYDYIIVDSSAAKEYIDSRILAGICDAVVYVIRYNKATRKEIQDTTERIRRCKGNIIGAVLNESKPYS